jgi:uncharacterized protein (TIGR03435 family)
MMNRIVSAIALCGLMLRIGYAQDTGPAFETATIKESAGPAIGTFAPDRFSRTNITQSLLLVYAHQMSEFQIVGGPDWVRERRFDVQAKAEGLPTADQMRMMVRKLLAERFALKTHLETRDLPRYALVMARSDRRLGPKLLRSKFDCPAIVAARGPDYRLPTGPPQPGDPPSCLLRGRVGGGSQTMMIEGQPMPAIAKLLQPRAGRVVIDKTGLTGTYDVELETEVMDMPGIPAGTFGQPREGLSLFTALPEQLGLKLESERGPVEVLVIDSVELPTPN